VTRAELISERLDTVAQLHAAMAIIDGVLDRITVSPELCASAKTKKAKSTKR
jgi:hypothetical protein